MREEQNVWKTNNEKHIGDVGEAKQRTLSLELWRQQANKQTPRNYQILIGLSAVKHLEWREVKPEENKVQIVFCQVAAQSFSISSCLIHSSLRHHWPLIFSPAPLISKTNWVGDDLHLTFTERHPTPRRTRVRVAVINKNHHPERWILMRRTCWNSDWRRVWEVFSGNWKQASLA